MKVGSLLHAVQRAFAAPALPPAVCSVHYGILPGRSLGPALLVSFLLVQIFFLLPLFIPLLSSDSS